MGNKVRPSPSAARGTYKALDGRPLLFHSHRRGGAWPGHGQSDFQTQGSKCHESRGHRTWAQNLMLSGWDGVNE